MGLLDKWKAEEWCKESVTVKVVKSGLEDQDGA